MISFDNNNTYQRSLSLPYNLKITISLREIMKAK